MKNIYSAIWMSGIHMTLKNPDPKLKHNWKLGLWFLCSCIDSITFVTLIFALQYFFGIKYSCAEYFGIHKIDSGLTGIIDYAVPPALLSYVCFFYKDRYKKLLPKYNVNKILSFGYMTISVMLFCVMLILMANR